MTFAKENMFKFLEKHWPIVSLLLFLALLACLLFLPSMSRPFGLALLILSVIVGLIMTVQKHTRAYQKGQLDQTSTFRNIFVDEFGFLISITVSILVGGRVGQAVGIVAGSAAERQWAGSGMFIGILSGLAVGILIGLAIGRLVQITWGRLVKRSRAVPAENGI